MARGLKGSLIGAFVVAVSLAAALPAWAAPASPHLLAKAKRDPALARRLEDFESRKRARGVDRPRKSKGWLRKSLSRGTGSGSGSGADARGAAQSGAMSAPSQGQVRALAILVDFSDKVAVAGAASFDSLLFQDTTGPASVRGYYREVSYGTLDLVTIHLPSVTGWKRVPQTLAYYANNDYGVGWYPQNAQKMVEDAIDAADPVVDFSQYDNDSDGLVDALFVVHAGRGAEYTGSRWDIWSHQWAVPWTGRNVKDGVRIWEYSTEPEYWVSPGDMTVGVYAHELGHVFGLPDLYDRDYSSQGIGDWSLMAGGSWNGVGPVGGDLPARPDAWSSLQLGFNIPVEVTGTIDGAVIPSVNQNRSGSVYRVRPWGALSGSEYFVLENRRKTGTDAADPGEGLLVWHIDETRGHNDDETRYMVDLEEAHGGTQNLTRGGGSANQGDTGDPFPGTSNKRVFWADSDPNSRLYSGSDSGLSLSDISTSAATMTARLGVGLGYPDGNDDIPGVVAGSSPVTGTLTSGLDRDDVFSVEMWIGQTLDVTLTGAPGTDYNVRLFAPGASSVSVDTPVASAEGATYPEVLTYVAADEGTHYVDLRAVTGSGSYSLEFAVRSSSDDSVPPDPVSGLAATPGAASVVLGWTNPTTDHASTRVLRSSAAFAGSPAPGGGQAAIYNGTGTGMTDTGLANGVPYYYTVFARDAAGNWSSPATATATPVAPPQATVLTAAASGASVSYGGAATVFGTLKTASGVAIPLRDDVVLWSRDSKSGSVWQPLGPAPYQLGGTYAGYYADDGGAITSSTWYELRFDGGVGYGGTESPSVLVKAKAWLPTPRTPSVARRGARLTTYGYLRPAHWSTTRLEYYRYSRGAWRLYRYRLAKNTKYGSYSRYSRWDRFYSTGSYGVRARHWDLDHDRTYSPWRYFRVR